MLLLTAVQSSKPDYVALAMVAVIAVIVAVMAIRKRFSTKKPVSAPVETAAPAAPAVAEPVKEEPAAAEAPSTLTHTVKDGEDTVSIAIMYGVSPSAVMDINDLKNTDSLKAGQVLKLPANAKVQ